MAVTSTVNILQESELTENFNFMKPTDFHVRIDRKRFHNLQFFANTVTHPGVSVSTPSLAIPRLQNMSVPGDTYAVDEVSMDILLDEDMKSYTEMHDWMRRILDQDMTTPVDRYKAKIEKPPAQSDITLSILSSSNNPVVRIRYKDCIPTALTDIQFQSTAGGESFITFGASFRFTYFDILTKNKSTGAFTESFTVTGSVTG